MEEVVADGTMVGAEASLQDRTFSEMNGSSFEMVDM